MQVNDRSTRSAETRLAEVVSRLRTATIRPWTLDQITELAGAVAAAGDTFFARRVLQRLERGEIDVWRALALFRNGLPRRASFYRFL